MFETPNHHTTDTLPLAHTTFEMLDLDRVKTHIDHAQKRGRLKLMDPIAFLTRYHGIITVGETLMPTIAGVLMFAKDPQAILPYAVVDIGHFYGTMAVTTEVVSIIKGIDGPITSQIDSVERYIWSNSHHGFRFGEGAQRIEEHEYPQSVIRELTVNALAHRDYSLYQFTRVSLFRNRIEWDNPGRLPDGVTIPTIRQAQNPRNPALLQFLYQAGYVEAYGMGWDTIFQALRDEELREPVLEETPSSFIVTVYGRPRGGFDAAIPAVDLNDHQASLYRLIVNHGSISRVDLETILSDRSTRSVQRDLQVLVEKGLIVATGATRSLRYRPA